MPTPKNTEHLEDELELDAELENYQDPPEEDVAEDVEEDPVDEDVEEPQLTAPVEDIEERVPKSRLDAERARADTLQQVLETLRTQMQQPQQQAPQRVVEDPEANLSPQDKQWREYIRQAARPEIERRVQEIVGQIKQQSIDPLHRVSIEVQDRIDEQQTRQQFRDYDQYRDHVNRTRAEWYQRYGVVAPRDVAYHYVKGQMALKQAPVTRTQTVRANAKQTATVPNKPPAKKVAPKGPITLDDVANMSWEDAERWLAKNGTKF